MEITIEINKWGFGFYSPWAAIDFTWGLVLAAAGIFLLNKLSKKYNLFNRNKIAK